VVVRWHVDVAMMWPRVDMALHATDTCQQACAKLVTGVWLREEDADLFARSACDARMD
jgi:hypothetical protein